MEPEVGEAGAEGCRRRLGNRGEDFLPKDEGRGDELRKLSLVRLD